MAKLVKTKYADKIVSYTYHNDYLFEETRNGVFTSDVIS